jgi:hypothetical protein
MKRLMNARAYPDWQVKCRVSVIIILVFLSLISIHLTAFHARIHALCAPLITPNITAENVIGEL